MGIAFDDGAADALISAADSADQALRSEGGFVSLPIDRVMEDFKGGYARLFIEACAIRADDRGRLAGVLAALADDVREAKLRARREKSRLNQLADWQQRAEAREREFQSFLSPLVDPMPMDWPVAAPTISAVFSARDRARFAGASFQSQPVHYWQIEPQVEDVAEKVKPMPFEPQTPLRASRVLAGLFCAAMALSACAPTMEYPMTGSNPSDPATVKAQVEELKQALADLHAFKVETQQTIGPQTWADKNLRNMDCRTSDGQGGVNYSVMSQTMETLDLEASVNVVRTFWESKGFTTRVETNPKDPGLIRLYANQDGGHLISYTANIKGSGLEMNSACVAGDQHAIYKELYPEIYGLPSNPSQSTTGK